MLLQFRIILRKCKQKMMDFFFNLNLDEEDRLKNIFWVDPRSKETYKDFRDVVAFDTTYFTNKYGMPFVPFVEVNHHSNSILLWCEWFRMRIWIHLCGHLTHGYYVYPVVLPLESSQTKTKRWKMQFKFFSQIIGVDDVCGISWRRCLRS